MVFAKNCNSFWVVVAQRLRIMTRRWYAPSLHATRAETRLTVYRAHHIAANILGGFPKILSQYREYLAALWSDLCEKLSRWS